VIYNSLEPYLVIFVIVGYCHENNEARNKVFCLALALGATHAALGAMCSAPGAGTIVYMRVLFFGSRERENVRV
jgi:hypothetical protein